MAVAEQNLLNQEEVIRFFSDPESFSENDVETLRNLTSEFPFCQAFHFAYAAAVKKYQPKEFNDLIQRSAVVSPSREVLFKFVHHPSKLAKAPLTVESAPDAIQFSERIDENADKLEETVSAEAELLPEEPGFKEFEVKEEAEGVEEQAISEPEEKTAEEIVSQEEIQDVAQTTFYPDVAAASFGLSFDIETVIPEAESPFEEKETEDHAEIKTDEAAPATEQTVTVPEKFPAEEKMIVGSIASSDYFIFDKSAVDPLKTEKKEEKPAELKLADPREEKEDLSKYHDDTLPYTFLWWLHKTRKEHAHTYQPYIVKPANQLKKDVDAALNQQIIENIFHIQPELNTFPQNTIAGTPQFELRKKEDAIIEKFIKEEPQIRPPQANKLDTENKARKSSEDNLDLVSETLAKIYIDQMLFHKAIDTYKKLSLKFPEKKLYFAGQIQELEKKIN